MGGRYRVQGAIARHGARAAAPPGGVLGRCCLHHRVALQRFFACLIVLHDGKRVGVAQGNTCCLQFQRPGRPRGVQRGFAQPSELRQVAAYELALRVKLLALADRVEDAEIGLCVAAARAGPLPATVVGGEVKALMARSNSPTLGHPKFPQAGPPDYDDSGATAMRAAASLRR